MKRTITFIFLLLAAITSNAQNYDTKNPNALSKRPQSTYWMNIGLGMGTLGGAGIFGFSYQNKHERVLSFCGSASSDGFLNYMWDVGLLYGLALPAKRNHVSIAMGLSVTGGSKSSCAFCEAETISPTIGLPIEIQLFLRPLRSIGLGICGFADINPQQTFAGVALALQIGKLQK